MSEIPHPRETFDAFGLEAAEAAFLSALDRRRLHHAWMLAGPPGVGKATLAYRAARRLLGARPAPELGALGSAPDDPVSRQVAARAHPDLLVLQLDAEDGKTRKSIPVEEARELPEFFAKTPAAAPWRVAIIDTADDLNASGANAVLKTLEEPPARGLLLLVTDRPGALLPTLRSRCRMLRFAAPAERETAVWLQARAGLSEADAARLSHMAGGAPGRAWRLAEADALALDQAAGDLLASLPRPDPQKLIALAGGFRGPQGSDRFDLMFARLAERVHAIASTRALAGDGAGLDAWAEAFELLVETPRTAQAVNLDREEAFYTTVSRLAALTC
jgi:DNA polymerase-3 subunit delta'